MITIQIGVDEAGRGAWAGPVVASAFAILKNRFKKTSTYRDINDSKQLTKGRRDQLFEALQLAKVNGEVTFYIASIDSEVVDTKGIKEANRMAMELAIQQIIEMIGKINSEKIEIHIDGNDHYRFNFSDGTTSRNIKIMEHIRGDQLFKTIGAASILAKVTRDRWMSEYSKSYPEYGFDRHKGYGTYAHQIALETFGILNIHRKSYSPIKHLIMGVKKI